jgi:hypothetical protein
MITLLLALAACDTGTKDTAPVDDTSADDTSDTDTDTDTPACSTLNSGTDWVWNGECPQMRTPCDIVVDGCSLTIDYDADGGMTMGMPYAGTIEGDTITFEDGDSVGGCVGTIEDADNVSGTCGDGCTFTLKR